MVEANSFSADVATLQSDVSTDVAGILQIAKERRESKKGRRTAVDQEASKVEAETQTVAPTDRPARHPRAAQRPKETAPMALNHFTSRLRYDLDERLTEAALHQKLKKAKPDTRQDIFNAAVEKWLQGQGY